MLDTNLDTGKLKLKPRARLIRTIGDELISSDIIAIMELVKNSYDANSEIVTIEFSGRVSQKKISDDQYSYQIDRETSTLSIKDEGDGMSLDTIKNVWMEPATIFKLINENKNKNRKYAGEKGIGRFASAKLAHNLEIITKTFDGNEVAAKFNWDDYSADKYLEDITNEWVIRVPLRIPKKGTILQMNNLLSDWDEDKLRNLRIELSRLMSPFSENIDFLIELKLPNEFSSLSGVINPVETLNHPNYHIKGTISSEGVPSELLYFSKKTNIEKSIVDEKLTNEFSRVKELDVGEFNFYFKVWNRDPEALSELLNNVKESTKEEIKLSRIKKDLTDLSGISIYRDNIRVMPYGTKENDWLRLDLRRVNNPTLRLSNNQIVGYISISLEQNPHLKDQSNREGIIDSPYFEQIKKYIKLILNELEIRRYNERPREEAHPQQTGLFDNLNLSDVITFVKADKYQKDKELHSLIEKKDQIIKHDVAKIKEITSSYRRLSSLGRLLEHVVHDGNQYLAKINLKLSTLDKKQDIPNERQVLISQVNTICDNFSAMIKRLTPFCGRRRGRPQEVILEEVIKNIFEIEHSELSKHKIKYILPTTNTITTADSTEISEIIMNLISNSIYWLGVINDQQRIIEVQIERQDSHHGVSIIFSDNGPGVKEESAQSIFDPYFTTKPDGMGLGLSMIGEIVSLYNGEFNLLQEGSQRGATFEIILRKRI